MHWTKQEEENLLKYCKELKNYESIAILLNKSPNSVRNKLNKLGFKITDFHLPKKYENLNCLNCNKIYQNKWIEKNSKFCSHSCSTIFNNKIRKRKIKEKEIKINPNLINDIEYELNLKEKNKQKRKEYNDKFRTKFRTKICDSCNIDFNCNSDKIKLYEDCNKYRQNIEIFNKLNIDKTISLKLKGLIALDILKNDYFIFKLSTVEIYEKYKIKPSTLLSFFKKHNIVTRNISESISLSFETGRSKDISYSLQYKNGYFFTWENKYVFYRSSYELDYINYLEENKISYDIESLRIKYFDTIKNKNRTAIPDFYLKETNTIVEIKSKYRFEFQNMIDRYNKFKELGYNFKLIYEHEEYIEDEFINKLYQSDDKKVLKK